MNVTSSLTRKDPCKRPHSKSLMEDELETKRLIKMMERDREDNIKANEKARQDNLDLMKSFLRNTILGFVSVIAKKDFTLMHATSVAPLQMIKPFPSSQQLVLANQAQGDRCRSQRKFPCWR